MTDAETLARLRASDMPPGEFLDALEQTQELTPLYPSEGDYAFIADEAVRFRKERDQWRFTAVASWGFWTLTLLVVWSNS